MTELEAKENNKITFIDGDKYYFIDSYMDINKNSYNSRIDEMLITISNAFKTKEQSEYIAEYISDKIKNLIGLYYYHLKYDSDFEPNCNSVNEYKYYIYFDKKIKKYIYGYDYYDFDGDTIYFSSCEIAQKICDELNEEI